MDRRVVAKEAVKRFAVRSTIASARLEQRVVPVTDRRPAEVARFVAIQRSRS